MAERSHAQQGFTLIEVVVALAIFGLAALALLRLQSTTLTGTTRLAQNALAQIVVRNLAVDMLTQPSAPTIGDSDGQVENGGITWTWQRRVARTDDARLVRIDLTVADDAQRTLARLSLARAAQ